MTDENITTVEVAEEEFNLDQVVSDAYDKATSEPDKESAEESSVAENTETKDQGSEELAKPAEKQPLEPHSRWSTEDKDAFKALPREAQEIVLKRESDVEKLLTQKTQEIAEQRKAYDSLETIIAPRRQSLMAEGGEVAVINNLLQLRDFSRSDPAGFVKWFAEQNGVDLGLQTKAGNQTQDPALLAQQRRIDALEQERNQERLEAKQAVESATKKEISEFWNEKDSNGNLKRPYANDVWAEMAALFKSDLVNNLQDAYDRAVYTNPATRAKILEDVKKSDEKMRVESAKSAASKAEKAVGVKVKTKTPASTGVTSGNWEDDLAGIVNAVYGA